MSKMITLSDTATETIRDMQNRVAAIASTFGQNSPEHTIAAGSLARVLSQLMLSGFGDADVSRDGELSLFVSENQFVYGIIFHADRGAAERMLRAHGHDPAENAELLGHYDGLAGSWSMHS